jgi:hypothetical protein
MSQHHARPSKHANVPVLVREHVDAGKYLDTRHAFSRMVERKITLPEVLYVLRHGHHEKRKDEFKEEHNAWTYAMRGKTVDKRELRVCVSFDENGMLIITTIDLDAKD